MAELALLCQQALARSYRRIRLFQWSRFEIFCATYGLEPLPATIRPHIAYLARDLQYSTILKYVSSLISYYHSKNFDALNISHSIIKEYIAGVQRQRFELPIRRAAIMPAHPVTIRENLSVVASHFRETFWATCLTAFLSLLLSANVIETHTVRSSCALAIFQSRLMG